MPIARHNKRRTGCLVCKRRKVKCGEELPSCANCVKRGEVCAYSPAIRFKSPSGVHAKLQSTTKNDASKLTRVNSRPSPVEADKPTGRSRDSMLELRLLHFFTVSTCHTISPSKELWMMAAPQSASQHEFLLDAVLAVSSLHWSVINPQDDWARKASLTYYARAVENHAKALQHVNNPDIAFALLLTSAIVTFFSLVQLGHTDSNQDSNMDEMQAALSRYISLSKGSKIIYRAHKDLFDNSDIFVKLCNESPDTYINAIAYAPGNREHLAFLEDWTMEDTTLTRQDKKSYEDAISYTGFIQMTTPDRTNLAMYTRRIVWMTTRLDLRFHEFLEERRPRALVILAHSIYALNPIESELWWLGNTITNTLNTISASIPEKWKALMPEVI